MSIGQYSGLLNLSPSISILCNIWNREINTFGPRCDKTCLWGFRQSEIQPSLLCYRDYLEDQNFACSKFRYDSYQNRNNKGADQSAHPARMRRLVCAFVVLKPPKRAFLASWPIYLFACWVIFHALILICQFFFENQLFWKILSVWVQIRPDVLSGLIWV